LYSRKSRYRKGASIPLFEVRLAPASALAAPVAAHDAAPAPAVNDANGTSPVVEIVLPNGCRLRVPAEIEASSLHRLLTVLKTAI
jgi:hypothetical protein